MSLTRDWLEVRDRAAEMRTFTERYGAFGDVERRTFKHNVAQTRKSGTPTAGRNDGSIQVVGHAAVFGQPSVEMASPFGMFTEFIDARAFDNVLAQNSDVLLTWDHDTRYPLARTANATLELTIDETGLRYWARCAGTSYAEDLRILMEGGYLDQSSFLFRIAPGGEEWSVEEDGEGNELVTRIITEVGGLYDVCVCAAGAYPTTDSGLMRTMATSYARTRGYLDERKAILYKETRKAPEDEAWDASAEVDKATADDLMEMCAWYDPEKKTADGELTKGAFKLPHHKCGDGYDVVWSGVKAAMSRLNQSNTQIPEADKEGVYGHLKKHYEQFNQEAPELRARIDVEAESRRVTEELRALGDVAWGPEEGVDDLTCDIECALNGGPWGGQLSVVDISVNLDKAIICDWNDYSFWVVPFTIIDEEPVPAEMSEWVQVETAWVTTTEGYEANIRSAKSRREARMAEDNATVEEETPTATEAEPETPAEPEVEVTEVEADADAEAPAEPEVTLPRTDAARLIAEARIRIARSKALK